MEKEPKNKMDTKKEYLYAYILATSSWKRKTVIRIRLQHQEIRVSEYSGGKFFRKVQAVISLAVCFFCCHKIKGRVYV